MALEQVFYYEFCKISKNTFYYKTPQVAASLYWKIFDGFKDWWQSLAIEKRFEGCVKSSVALKRYTKASYCCNRKNASNQIYTTVHSFFIRDLKLSVLTFSNVIQPQNVLLLLLFQFFCVLFFENFNYLLNIFRSGTMLETVKSVSLILNFRFHRKMPGLNSKVAGATLLKRDSNKSIFLWILQNF